MAHCRHARPPVAHDAPLFSPGCGVALQPSKSSTASAEPSGTVSADEIPAPYSPTAKHETPALPPMRCSTSAKWRSSKLAVSSARCTGANVGLASAPAARMSSERRPVSSDAAATPSRIAATVPPLAMAEPSRRLSGTAVVPISPRASGTDLGGKEGTRPLTKPGCRPHAATTAPKSTASMNATTPSAAETASVDPARRRAQQSGPLSHRKASRMALSSVSSSTPDATPEKMLHSYATLPASTNRVRACLATAFAPLGERSRIACPSERFPSIVSLPAASCNDHATATATATHQTSRWP
mmetsp:Transcript_27338/g.82627  ORF Transcript_27338/g.82627 Transcript_27338/m.82627 type:complete len:299 (-) Transcript_27338:139-1035(-)